jgi:uncharacterized protein (TIGR02145 family)
MKRLTVTLLLSLFLINTMAQTFTVTFSAVGSATQIDSVIATNLKTDAKITLPGGAALSLVQNTGIESLGWIPGNCLLYPNPNAGESMLHVVTGTPAQLEISVRDMSGKCLSMHHSQSSNPLCSFEIRVPAPGIYFVTAATSEWKSTQKLICTEASGSATSIRETDFGGADMRTAFKSAFNSYSLGYSPGDVILYRCFSGNFITLLTEIPASSGNHEVEFQPCTDASGKHYPVVKIGDQIWMSENLAWLPSVSPASDESGTSKRYYIYDYQGNSLTEAKAFANFTKYGVLYNSPASQDACPDGWELPAYDDWTGLKDYLATEVGAKLKETGISHWKSPNSLSTNLSGFSARGGGQQSQGQFSQLNEISVFRSKTAVNTNQSWSVQATDASADLTFSEVSDFLGQSVRCIRISGGNSAPKASFTFDPVTATSEILVTLDASGCSDKETAADDLQVRWDLDNDGSWDTEYDTNKVFQLRFAVPGTQHVALEVMDEGGLTATIVNTIIVSYPVFTDARDGRQYRYIRIGGQYWMAENLAWLPTVDPGNSSSTTEKRYYVYGYNGSEVEAAKTTENYLTYGVLYNGIAATDACPEGWHIPDDLEWIVLEKRLGMSTNDAERAAPTEFRLSGSVGGKLKETGTTHWEEPNVDATDAYGFTALPGGARVPIAGSQQFHWMGSEAWFWTAPGDFETISARLISTGSAGVHRWGYAKSFGHAIRCVKN